MAANIEQELIAKVRALPPDEQEEALDYIRALSRAVGPASLSKHRDEKLLRPVGPT